MLKFRNSIVLQLIPLLIAAAVSLSPQSTSAAPATNPASTQPAPTVPPVKGPWLLHLPGIGGMHNVNYYMLRGLRQGGVTGQFQYYDWTTNDHGLAALGARQINDAEAVKIADMIQQRRTFDPADPICLVSHSGGCGLAVWALEKLPANCSVDNLILLAPALSPAYDLTAALKHVSGKCYIFNSPVDVIILSTGTRLFGTIDGIKCDAAGLKGFVTPKTADANQYKKIVPMPYKPEWSQYGNNGEHIGSLSREFSATILAPLVSGTAPPVASASTQPDNNAAKH